jgi:hypothetical protein
MDDDRLRVSVYVYCVCIYMYIHYAGTFIILSIFSVQYYIGIFRHLSTRD